MAAPSFEVIGRVLAVSPRRERSKFARHRARLVNRRLYRLPENLVNAGSARRRPPSKPAPE
jgi:hypothetical protein